LGQGDRAAGNKRVGNERPGQAQSARANGIRGDQELIGPRRNSVGRADVSYSVHECNNRTRDRARRRAGEHSSQIRKWVCADQNRNFARNGFWSGGRLTKIEDGDFSRQWLLDSGEVWSCAVENG